MIIKVMSEKDLTKRLQPQSKRKHNNKQRSRSSSVDSMIKKENTEQMDSTDIKPTINQDGNLSEEENISMQTENDDKSALKNAEDQLKDQNVTTLNDQSSGSVDRSNVIRNGVYDFFKSEEPTILDFVIRKFTRNLEEEDIKINDRPPKKARVAVFNEDLFIKNCAASTGAGIDWLIRARRMINLKRRLLGYALFRKNEKQATLNNVRLIPIEEPVESEEDE